VRIGGRWGRGTRDAELAELGARLERLEQRADAHDFAELHTGDRLADAEREGDALTQAVSTVDRIAATTALVGSLPPATDLVSVIMPTRNRAYLLPRALASVRAQVHQTWELIVVDDGSTDETAALLADAARKDPRIRVLHAEGGGASAARNLGLDHASGRYVAYLDDDNVMGPQWLRGVVWAFDRHPEAQVGYGARVIDAPSSGAPWIEFQPWDRQWMQVRCIIDQNVLAHRAGLPELRYDVSVDFGSDWDAAIRATEDRDPVMIPVVSAVYSMSTADRLSEQRDAFLHWVRVQRAALRRRPLRVLGVDLAAPPLSDAEAADAIGRWRDLGAVAGWCAEGRSGAPADVPWFDHLGSALRDFGPAVVALHAEKVVPAQLGRVARARTAFIIVAPAHGAMGPLEAARAHPHCAGVWGPQGPTLEELLPALDRVRARQLGLRDPESVLAQASALPDLEPLGALGSR
jgi:hypothetical protein